MRARHVAWTLALAVVAAGLSELIFGDWSPPPAKGQTERAPRAYAPSGSGPKMAGSPPPLALPSLGAAGAAAAAPASAAGAGSWGCRQASAAIKMSAAMFPSDGQPSWRSARRRAEIVREIEFFKIHKPWILVEAGFDARQRDMPRRLTQVLTDADAQAAGQTLAAYADQLGFDESLGDAMRLATRVEAYAEECPTRALDAKPVRDALMAYLDLAGSWAAAGPRVHWDMRPSLADHGGGLGELVVFVDGSDEGRSDLVAQIAACRRALAEWPQAPSARKTLADIAALPAYQGPSEDEDGSAPAREPAPAESDGEPLSVPPLP